MQFLFICVLQHELQSDLDPKEDNYRVNHVFANASNKDVSTITILMDHSLYVALSQNFIHVSTILASQKVIFKSTFCGEVELESNIVFAIPVKINERL